MQNKTDPDFLSVLSSKEKIETDVYRFKVKNEKFLHLKSRCFGFRNPWTKEVEYIVSTNTVVQWVFSVRLCSNTLSRNSVLCNKCFCLPVFHFIYLTSLFWNEYQHAQLHAANGNFFLFFMVAYKFVFNFWIFFFIFVFLWYEMLLKTLKNLSLCWHICCFCSSDIFHGFYPYFLGLFCFAMNVPKVCKWQLLY